MNIDDFIQNNLPKKKTSVFDEHIEDINKLLELNYSQKQVIEFLKSKCKNKSGLSEQNLSFYLRKSKDKATAKPKKIDKEKSENTPNNNIEKKPIDIFTNLKGKDSKTSLEQDMLDFVKELK